MVTVAGTLTDAWLLLRDTVNPLAGASPLSVSVPVTEVPPEALEELKANRVRDTEDSVKASSIEAAGALAMMIADS